MTNYHARVAAVRARQGIPAPRHPFAARLYPALGFFVGAATLADHWVALLLMLPGFALLRSAVDLAGPVCPSCDPDMEDMWGSEATEIPLADRRPCARCRKIDY